METPEAREPERVNLLLGDIPSGLSAFAFENKAKYKPSKEAELAPTLEISIHLLSDEPS